MPHDLPFLDTIHADFGSTCTSAVDTTAGLLRGRPYGGVALLWRKSAFQNVSVITCANPRISAIRVEMTDCSVLVLSVYMPVDCSENLPEFTDCLGTISAIIEVSDVESVFVLGDFNAHPGERFCDELLSFSHEQKWICADLNLLNSQGAFTFISEAHDSKRWLDHCVVTQAAALCITDIFVKYDVYWSDHYPLVIKCNLNKILHKTEIKTSPRNKICWGDRNQSQITRYHNMCNSKLKCVDFPIEYQYCSGKHCNLYSHRQIIDKMYRKVVNILCEAARASYIPNKGKRKKLLAGWNKHVSEAYRNARLKFRTWVSYGKPTHSDTFNEMVQARKEFKSKLKWCQNNQDQIKMDIMAKHHAKSDFKNFWKSTNTTNQGLETGKNFEPVNA
ncbi:hypothetical protein PYW07_002633 [Mythimna separata]|uniref:Endonuclease/exonuclease/phosphatase domain-containing protein n=1 Tax=Mythimna separata TaxID=271217 RepID=A0AAD7YGM3_MYTSE|nr:hypothetical protein PYW07_002633 [Mythimna separata]